MRAEVMLERLGKLSGWVGTSFAVLAFVYAFMKWSPGHGEPFILVCLPLSYSFSLGRPFATSLSPKAPCEPIAAFCK